MSRVIKFATAGGPDVLEFVETEVPAPGPAEVRIKVKAIGINRAESMWRTDVYIEPVSFPAGLGYEAAGIVDAVGSEVPGIAVGDAVSVVPSFSMRKVSLAGWFTVMCGRGLSASSLPISPPASLLWIKLDEIVTSPRPSAIAFSSVSFTGVLLTITRLCTPVEAP